MRTIMTCVSDWMLVAASTGTEHLSSDSFVRGLQSKSSNIHPCGEFDSISANFTLRVVVGSHPTLFLKGTEQSSVCGKCESPRKPKRYSSNSCQTFYKTQPRRFGPSPNMDCSEKCPVRHTVTTAASSTSATSCGALRPILAVVVVHWDPGACL